MKNPNQDLSRRARRLNMEFPLDETFRAILRDPPARPGKESVALLLHASLSADELLRTPEASPVIAPVTRPSFAPPPKPGPRGRAAAAGHGESDPAPAAGRSGRA